MSSGAMPVKDQMTVTTGISTLGKNIGWHALYGYNAQHDQQERNYNKGVRAPQRQPHNPHSALP
jgi:hypothetical protein